MTSWFPPVLNLSAASIATQSRKMAMESRGSPENLLAIR